MLATKEKIGYGFGDMASSMFWKLFGTYLLYFYTDIFGITATAAATLFLITRTWDTLFDPLVGIIADRTRSTWGRFRPYLLFMAIPFGIIGVLTFTTPSGSYSFHLVYAYVTYSLMMMIYSLINVPYAALLGVMSADVRDRNSLASFRMAFAFVGSLLSLALIEPLVSFFERSGRSTQQSWIIAVAVIGIICVALFLFCFRLVRERVYPISQERSSLKEDIGDLIRNRPWWILLVSGIFALIFNSLRDGAAIYYFKYVLDASAAFSIGSTSVSYSTLYLILGQAANIIGVIIASPIANTVGKKKTYFVSMLLAAVFSIGFYWLGKETVPLIFLFQFLISVCAGVIFPLLWSMYADIADYSEWKTGRRATGLVFSSSSMSQKFGWAIGGSMAGWLLYLFGFKANMAQSAEAQIGIRTMLSFLPAIGAVLSVFFIGLYPLPDGRVREIQVELEERRALRN